MTSISSLPVELLNAVFDHFELTELLGLTRVCWSWRTVGIQHRTYWRDLSICDEDIIRGGLGCFIQRLEYGAATPSANISVTVRCPETLGPDERSAAVFDELCFSLDRVRSLHLELDLSATALLTSILCGRTASSMTNLCIRMSYPSPVDFTDSYRDLVIRTAECMSTFLAESCPALRTVELCDVPLCPVDEPSSCLLNVLRVGAIRCRLDICVLATIFPDVAVLETALANDPAERTIFSLEEPCAFEPTMRHIRVRSEHWHSALAQLSAFDTPIISVQCDSLRPSELSDLIPAGKPLSMVLRSQPHPTDEEQLPTGVLTISTKDGSAVRHVEGFGMADLKLLDQLVLAHADRLVSLSVSMCITLIDLCQLSVALPRLETLSIATGVIPKRGWQYGSISVPRLRTLILRCESEKYGQQMYARRVLDGFITQTLAGASSLRVLLKGIRIKGRDNLAGHGCVESLLIQEESAPFREASRVDDEGVTLPPMLWFDDLNGAC